MILRVDVSSPTAQEKDPASHIFTLGSGAVDVSLLLDRDGQRRKRQQARCEWRLISALIELLTALLSRASIGTNEPLEMRDGPKLLGMDVREAAENRQVDGRDSSWEARASGVLVQSEVCWATNGTSC